ncbi:NAD-dependent epimerase/dehydratase family protein [bacterium]|nr:NAD-dependent epimerase/dehydratase family protein [bacterium]
MKILVTGGAGFIGSNIVDRYLAEGHDVAILDNLSTGRRENIDPRARLYEVDIRDWDRVLDVFATERPQILNHHAAQMDVRRGVEDPAFDAATNIVGSIYLLEAALRNGIEKVIYASSGGACYGEPDIMPAPETAGIHPISQYGISKHTVEHYLWLYNYNDGLRYTVLRYANVYGPRQNPHGEAGVTAIFSGMMLRGEQPRIFGKGDKTRDYVYVGDVVQANVLALTRGDNDIFNIGTGVETADQEVYDAIAAATGYAKPAVYAEERKGEIRRTALDARKAKEVLGWEPSVNFRQGCQLAVDYVRSGQAAK